MKPEVKIVGGGIAGLTAALYAARAGARVELFEAVSELGGRARTREDSQFLFNMGPHALYKGGPAWKTLGELGVRVSGSEPPTKGAMAEFGKALHALPAGFVSLVSTGMFSLAEKLELGRYLAKLLSMDASNYDSRSLADVLSAELRHPPVRHLIAALVRLTSYTHAPERMSAGAAFAQVQLAFKHNVLYLDGGWRTLVASLVATARSAGVRLRSASRVRALEFLGPRLRGLRLADDERVVTDAVILAMGPGEASSLVHGGAHKDLREQAERFTPIRAAALDLGLSRLPVPHRTFVLGIDEPLYFSVHSASAQLAPEGQASVQVMRYLAPDEKPERAELERELEEFVERVQPGWREHVVSKKLMTDLRVSHAVIDAERGGLEGRPGPRVTGLEGLFVAGDWVGPAGHLVDAAFASGRCAGHLAAGESARERAR